MSLRSGAEAARFLDPGCFRISVLVIRKDGGALFREHPLGRADREALARKASLETLPGIERCSLLDALEGIRRKGAVALLALHGPGGEDGTMQGCLETLRIPYTGSGVIASAIGMDKIRFREFAAANGIPTAPGIVLPPGIAVRGAAEIGRALGFPCMVKIPSSGSSIGVWKCGNAREAAAALAAAWRDSGGKPVLAEAFLAGREVTVPVWEPSPGKPAALPVIEIRPAKGRPFFDLEAKYDAGACEEIVPAPIPDGERRAVQALGLKVHVLLGCRGFSRTDIILARGKPFVLEINTIPGMTAGSLLPKAARAAGHSLGDVLAALVRCAKK